MFESSFVMVGLKIIQLNDLHFDIASEQNPFMEINPEVLDHFSLWDCRYRSNQALVLR